MTDYNALVLKTCFYISAYNFGRIYKEHMEEKFNRNSRLKITMICVCIVTNLLLLLTIGYENMIYNSTDYMQSFHEPFYLLPVLTSFTGIIFWLFVAELLSKYFKYQKIVDTISRNLIVFLEFHLLIGGIPLLICASLYKKGFCQDFDFDKYFSSPWYKYNIATSLAGFLLALLVCYFLSIIIAKTKIWITDYISIMLKIRNGAEK